MTPKFPARMVRLTILAAVAWCLGCDGAAVVAPHAPAEPRRHTQAAIVAVGSAGVGEVKLIEPNEEHFVVELANGVDVEAFLLRHELVLLGRTDDILLVSGAESDSWLDTLPEVSQVSRNRAVDLTEGQDLVFGFDEGDWDEQANVGQDAFDGLDLRTAHGLALGTDVLVAVLDTGADPDHVHLAGSLVLLDDTEQLASRETANGIDDDGDTNVDEAFGHGTHVAGIVRTVAPGAWILPIRVLNDDGIGSLWDLILGLQLAHQYGAEVINMSLSLSAYSQVFEDVLAKLRADGVSLVGAGGNHGWASPSYPAVSPLVLGVAALDLDGQVAEFSGAGPLISVAAPGTSVMSSYPGDLMVGGTGTSMATPVISGCVALLMSRGSAMAQAELDLLLTSKPVGPEEAAPNFGQVSPTAALQKK